MKTIVLWIWAFWFAILKYIAKNNLNTIFYAYEKDEKVFKYLKENNSHPYFFWDAKLPNNIKFIDNLQEVIPEIDLIISVIPCQFATKAIEDIKDYLKEWVTILNLAKWINNKTLETLWDSFKRVLPKLINYNYADLSGGMIASELVEMKQLWADIAIENKEIWLKLKKLFESDNLEINLINSGIKNLELYGALKNIIAIIIWYYEWQWNEVSTLSYYFCKLYEELKDLIVLLWWEKDINFSNYALWGDLITTCFGNSRNRYFWKLLWSWKTLEETLEIFKQENKIAEGYETIKWVYKMIEDKKGFKEIKKVYKKLKITVNDPETSLGWQKGCLGWQWKITRK